MCCWRSRYYTHAFNLLNEKTSIPAGDQPSFWWVKMEKRGSHWCVCVDSKNCKYIDRWRPLWVLCYCKTLAGNLPMLITVCTRGWAWWSLFVSYLQLLSFIWLQYEHELLRLLISGLSRALACSSDTEYDSTRFCSCRLCRRMVCAQFDLM